MPERAGRERESRNERGVESRNERGVENRGERGTGRRGVPTEGTGLTGRTACEGEPGGYGLNIMGIRLK